MCGLRLCDTCSYQISAYCNQLARKVAANCVAKWGTALLCDVSQFASMISVRLPPFAAPVNSGELRKVLRRNYMIEVRGIDSPQGITTTLTHSSSRAQAPLTCLDSHHSDRGSSVRAHLSPDLYGGE